MHRKITDRFARTSLASGNGRRLLRTVSLAIGLGLACWALPASAVVVATAGAINGETMTLKNKVVPLDPNNVLGNFDGVARASVPVGSPANAVNRKTATTGKLVGAAGDTMLASETAGGVTAEARTKWTVGAGGGGAVLLGTKGSFASVTGARPPSGIALSYIKDPTVVAEAAGQTFELSFGLVGGADGFGLQALGADAAASIATFAGSDLPGLTSLFFWSASLHGSDPSSLNVNFVSNPLLGLNDTSIRSALHAALAAGFDAGAARYSLPSDLTYASFDLTVPLEQESLQLVWNSDAAAQLLAPIPEPESYAMMFAGLVVLGAIVRRRSAWHR